MNSDCFVFVEERDEFRMWQGLVGPHYTPAVDSLGNLSWTNNGNLVNPPTVNVSGRGLTITGIVDTAGDLPASAPQYTCYLVGTTAPYYAYIWDGTSWTDLGVVGKGDTGDDGFSPVVTVTTITGGHEVSIEDANGTQTFDVMDGQDGAPGVGVPSGGTDGQMLVKDGSTDYATKWQNQPTIPSAYTSNPKMDGTASPGSSTAWAKGDHIHPHDTSKADTGLGITGATVGKVPVISAVDGNGVPTAFDFGDGGGGGSGEQFLVSLPVANWYQQTPDSSYEFWYACDITPGDFDSAEQDVQISAANEDTYEWLSNNAFYELDISSGRFSLQARAIPTFALQVFYELKTRGENL